MFVPTSCPTSAQKLRFGDDLRCGIRDQPKVERIICAVAEE